MTNRAHQIRDLHVASGLTWRQLGLLFGSTARAVHWWVCGGRMTVRHDELLDELAAIVDGLDADTPAARAALLLAPGDDGRSIFDNIRARSNSGTPINGPAFTVAELLGA